LRKLGVPWPGVCVPCLCLLYAFDSARAHARERADVKQVLAVHEPGAACSSAKPARTPAKEQGRFSQGGGKRKSKVTVGIDDARARSHQVRHLLCRMHLFQTWNSHTEGCRDDRDAHTPACASIREHKQAREWVAVMIVMPIRQHTSAYASIRQHKQARERFEEGCVMIVRPWTQ
jgi:hypothetical protein